MEKRSQGFIDHVSRAGRALPALASDHFRLDERSAADLIAFAYDYAGLLAYTDEDDNVISEGAPWQEFFRHDVTFLLARICGVDARGEYRASLDPGADLAAMTTDTLKRLLGWQLEASSLPQATTIGTVEAALCATLDAALTNEMAPLMRHSARQTDVGMDEKNATRLRQRFAELDWSGFLPGHLTPIFSGLNRITGQVVAVAAQHLAAALTRKSDHPPQAGLVLAFIRLFGHAQDELGRITERHLLFHYKRVLRLTPRPQKADHAHLTFTIAPALLRVTLPAGTRLLAPSLGGEEPIIYATDRDLEATSARVTTFRALNVERRRRGEAMSVHAIRAYPVADSSDGFGGPLALAAPGWPPFGPRHAGREISDRAEARIGLAVSAPVLRLGEGEREITLAFQCVRGAGRSVCEALAAYRREVEAVLDRTLCDVTWQRLLDEALSAEFSTAEGFMRAPVRIWGDGDRLCVRLSLAADAPALAAAPGQGAVPGALPGSPTIRLLLNPSAVAYAYSAFRDLRMSRVDITVAVRGLRRLSLQNNLGPADATKPFAPFGPRPVPPARLLFTSPELWGKSLTHLAIRFEWQGLPPPPSNLASHYEAYGLGRTDADFRARLMVRKGLGWHPVALAAPAPDHAGTVALFDARGPGRGLSPIFRAEIAPGSLPVMPGPPDAEDPVPYDASGSTSFLALEFVSPQEGFADAVYPEVFSNAARDVGPLRTYGLRSPAALPPPPLSPLMSQMMLEYGAEATLSVGAPDAEGAVGRITPFDPDGPPQTMTSEGSPFPPHYDVDGMLAIGIADLKPRDVLTLLFDIAELRAQQWTPHDGTAFPLLDWYYRTDGDWRHLPREAVLEDETSGLTRRGIVRLRTPGDIGGPPLGPEPTAPFWLAVAIEGDPDRYGLVRAVTAQAVRATRVLPPPLPPIEDGEAEALPPEPADAVPANAPAGAITRLAEPVAGIVALAQPFATSGGRRAETEAEFRIRVSERLRHKARAVERLDYEQLVLDAFPEVQEVRCVPSAPGAVTVVVTPRRDGPIRNGDLPVASLDLRLAVRRFLLGRVAQTVEHIIVRDPFYETVSIRGLLRLSERAAGNALHDIEEAITRHIAPWILDPDVAMAIGTARLDPDALRTVITDRSNVAALVGLSLVQTHCIPSTIGGRVRFGLKDTARAPADVVESPSVEQRALAAIRDTSDLPHKSRPFLCAETPFSVLVPVRPLGLTLIGARRGLGHLHVGTDLYAFSPHEAERYRRNPDLIPVDPQAPPRRTGIGALAIGRDFAMTSPADAVPRMAS